MLLKTLFTALLTYFLLTTSNLLSNPFHDNFKIAPKEFQDTIYIPGDTIYQVDTIIYIEEVPFIWTTGFYFAPAFPLVKHKGNGDPVLDDLVKNEFSLSTSYMFGMMVNLGYLDWNLESGLNIYLLNEKLDYEGSNEFIIEESFEYEYIIDDYFGVTEDDDTIYVSTPYTGDSTIYTTEYLPSPQLNKYYYLEIPFGFSHAFHYKKVDYDLKLAVITGILLNKKRRNISYDSEYTFIDLSKHNKIIQTNFSLYFGVLFNYHITSNIGVFAEPFYRQHLNPILKTNNPIAVVPRMVGIKTGVKIQF